jgi:hypothetical protein
MMLRDEGIALDPPPSDDQPRVSWQRAVGACSSDSAECGDNGTPDVYLAVATDNYGGDATGSSVLRHDLTYILEWHGERCAPAGGPPQPPGSTRSPAMRTYSCGLFDFVNAKTGRFVTAIESPGL